MENIRVRFPPSPTGYLHIGGLRTALYNYLFARHHKGAFVLRIEDTDQARKVEGGAENIIRSLQRTGLLYDEGPFLKGGEIEERGNHGPYTQSKRLDIYVKHAELLLESGHAYRCDCSSERLDEVRKTQQKNGEAPMYDRHCRERTDVDPSGKHVIRFKMPREGETSYKDIVRGDVSFQNVLIDDYVLLKTDGYPTYHLANVIDDHFMKISHVIRGEEWVPSMPKHLLLYEAFGWDAPEFAHLPLLLNEDRSKLSKRQGDVAVEDYLDKGYLPEALLNFVALLGWNPFADREQYDLKELIEHFDLAKVNSAGAVFNREKLDWMNGKYIRSMTPEEFAERAAPFLENAGMIMKEKDGWAIAKTGEHLSLEDLGRLLSLEQERIKILSELPDAVAFIFEDELDYPAERLVWKKSNAADTVQRIVALIDRISGIEDTKWTLKDIEDDLKKMIEENEWGNGDTLWPLRVALSGQEKSPGPFEIMTVLGKMKVLQRLDSARKRL